MIAEQFDVAVIGAGPAGLAASVLARRHGMSVACIDEQPEPGGQIWRAVERVAATTRGQLLGSAYLEGQERVAAFRECGATYLPNCGVWQIEPDWILWLREKGSTTSIKAKKVVLATGAQERPAPVPGWTLPGVLTVGAAQILLKTSAEIPSEPVWIVGCGPLVILYATQLLRNGGQIAGWIDTSPPDQLLRAGPHFLRAVFGAEQIIKGLGWLVSLKRARFPIIRGATEIEVLGGDHVEGLKWCDVGGILHEIPAQVVLLHEGIIPSNHAALSLDCEMSWHDTQNCYVPALDDWGESSRDGLFIVGDGAGAAGADAAVVRGELAALAIASQLGLLNEATFKRSSAKKLKELRRLLAIRPFLDAMYPPRSSATLPSDDTIVCRCEELTAGNIRAAARKGNFGFRRLKSESRAGMGACQGRQCGAVVQAILAECQGLEIGLVDPPSVRPPLKPVTLSELATYKVSD